jgi:ABC-type antimicrobial peptide transport system permease subunit
VLAVINNAMMMATLRRTREIGTLRAIGAQRAFVLAMVLVETMVLSLVFGLAGMGAGALLVKGVNALGIPAVTDEMQFFFSGPQLDLFVSPTSLVAAFVMVVVVTAISTLYPAVQATRISPVTAMQSEE